MDTDTPFPSFVSLRVEYRVTRWWVIAYSRLNYRESFTPVGIVMMRPFPNWEEANRFMFTHVPR